MENMSQTSCHRTNISIFKNSIKLAKMANQYFVQNKLFLLSVGRLMAKQVSVDH